MTDYTKLVAALRGKFIAYDVTGNHNSAQLYNDAADAIEKLVTLYEKAEIDATNLTGKLAQAEAQLPKRGEWIDMGDFEQCSVCHGTHLKEFQSYYGKVTWVKSDFCGNCGADMRKMEVQE